MKWKWRRCAQTDRVDFGNPLDTTSYALCVYDETSGVPALVMTAIAPAGGTCGNGACWKETARGFKYLDRDATPDGLLRIRLQSGTEGRAMISVSGRGVDLDIPPPFGPTQLFADDPGVLVQLVKSDGMGECWEAAYPSPANENTATRFKDQFP